MCALSLRRFFLRCFVARYLDQFYILRCLRRLYIPLFALLAIGLPVAVPCYFWSESLWISFWVSFNLRFCITLNIAFCVNSVAHMWGHRPYDKYVYLPPNLFGMSWIRSANTARFGRTNSVSVRSDLPHVRHIFNACDARFIASSNVVRSIDE